MFDQLIAVALLVLVACQSAIVMVGVRIVNQLKVVIELLARVRGEQYALLAIVDDFAKGADTK